MLTQRHIWLKTDNFRNGEGACLDMCVCVCLVIQLCPTLCNTMDSSLPGSSVCAVLQARILEWVAILFSGVIFSTQGSNLGLPHCRWILYHLSHKGKPKNTGVDSLYLLQRIFLTQESNGGSPALQVDSLPTELSEKPLNVQIQHINLETFI